MNIPAKLRQLDAYPKTLDDFQIKTSGGAIGTILTFYFKSKNMTSEFCSHDYYDHNYGVIVPLRTK